MGLFHAPAGIPIESHPDFRVSFGGAESNVAIGLARLGRSVEWIGRLGDDDLGRLIARELRAERVSVQDRIGGGSTGIMVRTRRGHARAFVQYARNGSAGAALSPEDLDLEAIRSARLLHLTGITPALGAHPREAVDLAIETAREAGVLVSFDINHREALWDSGDAHEVLAGIAARSDVLFATDAEGRLVLGVAEEELTTAEIAAGLAGLGAPEVIVKMGKRGSLSLVHGARFDQRISAADEVDPVGAGDAFAAGYIHALLADDAPQRRIDFAGEVAAHAVTIAGDWEGLPRTPDLNHSGADILR